MAEPAQSLRLTSCMLRNALVEYPFALPAPTRLDGREAIRRYFAAVARMPLELKARRITVHQTSDPEVIVAESTKSARSALAANRRSGRYWPVITDLAKLCR